MFARPRLPAVSPLAGVALAVAATLLACSSKEPTNVAEDAAAAEDAVVAPLEYPPGPYGLKVGNVYPNFAFKGYRDGTGEWTDITMLDYYDPDGSRGINGIYLVVSAQWCPPCREEAKMLPGMYTSLYKPRGARFLTTMIEDTSRNPATQKTVDQWLTAYRLNFDIALDDGQETLPQEGSVGLPYNYVINPRDMRVFRIVQGVNPEATTITPLSVLLRNNGAPPIVSSDGGVTDAVTD